MSNDLTQFKIPVGTRGRWGETQNSLIDSLQNIENELSVARGFEGTLGANLSTNFATKEYVNQALIAGPGGDFSALRITSFTTDEADLDKVGYVLQIASGGGVLGFTDRLRLGVGTETAPTFSFMSANTSGMYLDGTAVTFSSEGGARLKLTAASTNVLNGLDVTGVTTLRNSLTTSLDTFSLLNTVATNISFAGAATTLTIGATTGTSTVRNSLTVNGTLRRLTNTVWDAGNDGAGSGLDADLLDGLQSATANTASTIVARDASGNFSAGTITAALSGNATTASRWLTARTVTLDGDATGSVSIDGSANATLTVTVADDSHTHDGRYFTEAESDARYLARTGGTLTGVLTINNAVTDKIILEDSNSYWLATTLLDGIYWNTTSDLLEFRGTGTTRASVNLVSGNITAPTFTGSLVGNADTATRWATARTITLGGDLTGNVSIDGSANVTLTATIAANSVALGTDTTGNYAASVAVSGNGLTITGAAGEGTAYTVTSNGTTAATANTLVYRDANADFSVRYVTATRVITADINSTGRIGFFNATAAQGINAGSVLASDTFTDAANVPTNGIWTKGDASFNNTTVRGNAVITGNLTVNGTTNTINSTTTTLDDPIITLGGDTAPTVDDNKDRGVEFRWHDGTSAKLGFFGRRDSNGRLAYIPDGTNTSEVFSGTLGDIEATTFHGALSGNATTASRWLTARTITLDGDATGSVSIDGSANVTLTVTVTDDSHTHDGRYYTETEADARFANITGDTFTGQVVTTATYSAATGAGQLYLNAAAGNRIDWNANGAGGPATTTRSAGTKLTLSPTLSTTLVDFAIGIDTATLWNSVSTTTDSFKWYAGTNLVGMLSGTGVLTVASFVGALTGNATTATTLQTARTINGVSFNGSANITITANTTNTLTRGAFLTGADFNGSAATTWAVDATTTNTANKVVARDASGNFAAGTITASLNGNATTATTATNLSGGSVNDTTGAFSGALTRAGNTVWDAGNDGSGSGLDADLLDGYQASLAVQPNTIPVRRADGTLDVGGGRASLAFVKYTTPGTFNFVIPSGVSQVRVMAQAAGGAGAPGTTAGNGYGTGGSAGGYAEGWFSVTPGDTITVVVGAGGTAPAGSVASPVGGNGGNTTVSGSGISITATGGLGGVLRSMVIDKKDITYLSYLVDGSSAAGGDRNLVGGDGLPSTYLYTADYSPSTAQGPIVTEEYAGAEPFAQAGFVIEGIGGDSHFAKWGKPQIRAASSNGRNAPGYGAGGGGATDIDAATGYTGGNGGNGIVVIEY